MQRICSVVAVGLLAAAASAQFSLVIPQGLATTEGNSSNAFPWGRGGTGLRIQTVYDSSHFTAQGVTYPIFITGLRWRPNTAVALTASSYTSGCTVQLSTSPLDQAAVSPTMASNQGANLTTCFSGVVSWAAQAAQTGPTPFGIVVPFSTNFLYDPNGGDLNIECDLPVQTFTGSGPQLDVQTTAPLASRIYISTGYPGTGNGTINLNHGVVVQVDYVPANGLFSSFTSNFTGGASPLAVNFTDQSFTSAPNGITSWAWDLNGDTVVDSTVQNPTFTYTACGSYNVSLTTTDGVNPPSTLSRTAYIVTDVVRSDFTYSVLPGTTAVQFTDTSVPTPTSWAWDFNGDNVVDSTVQNPAYVYPTPCTSNRVSLTANRLCGPNNTKSKDVVLANAGFQTLLTGGNGLSASGSGNCFDLTVLNPGGVTVCGITVAPYAATTVPTGTPITCDVYLTDAAGGYAANHTNASVWRLVASGSGTYQGGTFTAPVPAFMTLNTKLYIPTGTYGMAIHMNGCGVAYTTLTAATTYANADLSLTAGNGKGAPFSATANANRAFNGIFHYDLSGPGSFAGYGFFGSGCTNSLGSISRLTPTTLPILGQTASVSVTNLPLSAAIMAVGFSKTTSSLGALPASLTPLGAPGCFARVSADATLVIVGAANSAAWNLTVPNNPSLAGVQFYNQAFAIDPTLNLLGIAVSDAAGAVIGI